MKQKLQHLQAQLAHGFVGRDEIIKSALLSVVAGENLLLIGPPGTGKSMVARRVSQALKTEQTPPYFEYLLTKFSTPEEIFGTLSISELKQDRFKRNTQGYLPTVKIAFLDEIFKASSSILNALLTILNERKFHNGTITEDVPLQSLIGASNELPLGQTELSALYDRFLIRRFVDYVDESSLSALFNLPNATTIQDNERLTAQELKEIQQNAKNVEFPHDVQFAILEIWKKLKEEFKENSDEQFSDRRFVKLIHLMRISAVTNGRNQVDFSDVLLLKDCVWDNPENIEKCLMIIKTTLCKFDISIESQNSQKNKVKVTGYKGNGTKNSPFLINNLQDLQGLERPEVGQQGYYFKQTADIDASSLSEWINIELFIGHYDGGNHKIIAKQDIYSYYLFQNIKYSQIHLLYLENNLYLGETLENSLLFGCFSNFELFSDVVTNSNITFCGTESSICDGTIDNSNILACSANLICNNKIENSSIKYCKIQGEQIAKTIIHSKVENCFVVTGYFYYNNHGFIANYIYQSYVENCFIASTCDINQNDRDTISAIAFKIENTKITHCFIGKIYSTSFKNYRLVEEIDGKSILHNNISVHTNLNKNNDNNHKNNQNGGNIDESLFSEHYLTHHLKWDFTKIWKWDKDNNIPDLRLDEIVKNSISLPDFNYIPIEKNSFSLLQKQIKSNIWL